MTAAPATGWLVGTCRGTRDQDIGWEGEIERQTLSTLVDDRSVDWYYDFIIICLSVYLFIVYLFICLLTSLFVYYYYYYYGGRYCYGVLHTTMIIIYLFIVYYLLSLLQYLHTFPLNITYRMIHHSCEYTLRSPSFTAYGRCHIFNNHSFLPRSAQLLLVVAARLFSPLEDSPSKGPSRPPLSESTTRIAALGRDGHRHWHRLMA